VAEARPASPERTLEVERLRERVRVATDDLELVKAALVAHDRPTATPGADDTST